MKHRNDFHVHAVFLRLVLKKLNKELLRVTSLYIVHYFELLYRNIKVLGLLYTIPFENLFRK